MVGDVSQPIRIEKLPCSTLGVFYLREPSVLKRNPCIVMQMSSISYLANEVYNNPYEDERSLVASTRGLFILALFYDSAGNIAHRANVTSPP